MHLGRGLVVAVAAPGEAGASVVAVLRVAEREFHEALEGDAVGRGNLRLDDRREGRRTLREGEVVGRLRAHGVIVAAGGVWGRRRLGGVEEGGRPRGNVGRAFQYRAVECGEAHADGARERDELRVVCSEAALHRDVEDAA